MKKCVATDKAPQAIGPYSQAVEAGGFIFVSRQILAAENQRCRRIPTGDRQIPPGGGFRRVCRAKDVKPRHSPQHGKLLNRFMSRPVLADADTVMGKNVSHRKLHQRRQPHHRLHVVAENEKGRRVRPQAAVKGYAIDDSGHRQLPNAEMNIASAVIFPAEISRFFHHGFIRGR